jgi:hypothetical protein
MYLHKVAGADKNVFHFINLANEKSYIHDIANHNFLHFSKVILDTKRMTIDLSNLTFAQLAQGSTNGDAQDVDLLASESNFYNLIAEVSLEGSPFKFSDGTKHSTVSYY